MTAETPSFGLSERLRRERVRLQLTQADFARRAGVSQAAVSNWESGRRTPDLADLFRLARALDRDVADLLPEARQPAQALLRAAADRLASADLLRAVDRVDMEAAKRGLPARELNVRSTSPIRAADELLRAAGITRAPVDVARLARRCGALVVEEEFDDSLSGLVVRLDEGAVIGVNLRHHENRRRFTLAHELGHLLLEHHERFHLDVNDGAEAGFNYSTERAANEFAAEVLMPPDLVEAAYRRTPDTAKVAKQFAVSELAMGYRLVNLGLR